VIDGCLAKAPKVTTTVYRHGDGLLLMRFDIPVGCEHTWSKRITKGSHAFITLKGSGWLYTKDRRRKMVPGEILRTEPGEEFSCDEVTEETAIVCLCVTSDENQRSDTIGDRKWPNPLVGIPLEVW